jgi:cytochrome c553
MPNRGYERLAGALLLVALAACQSMGDGGAGTRMAQAEPHHPSLAFAQGACGGCHAVEHPGLSPNPSAPPFAAIVNREA